MHSTYNSKLYTHIGRGPKTIDEEVTVGNGVV